MNRSIMLALALAVAACGENPDRVGAGGSGSEGGAGGSGGIGGSGGTGGWAGAGGSGGTGGHAITPSIVIHMPAIGAFVSGASVPVKGIASGNGDDLVSIVLQANDGAPIELLDEPTGEWILDTVVDTRAGENEVVIRLETMSGGEATSTISFIGDGGGWLEPTIRSFDATPGTASPGETVTLRWDVIGTSPQLWIDGIGDVSGLTERNVVLPLSRTFTLHADNRVGFDTATTTVTIAPGEGDLRTRPRAAQVPPGARVPLYVEDAGGAALVWGAGAVTPNGAPDTLAIWQAPAQEGSYEVTVETQGASPRRSAVIAIEVVREAPLPAVYESAGGNTMHVERPEALSVSDQAGNHWAVSPRLSGIFHGNPIADRWTTLPTPPFVPEALVRLDDGTLVVGHATGGIARLQGGASAWESIGTGYGALLATRGNDLFRFAYAGSFQPSQIERFDGSAWVAFGPTLAMGEPSRYVVDSAGGHWISRRRTNDAGPSINLLPADGSAWEDAGNPLALAPMLQAGPGGRVVAAQLRNIAVYEGGVWTEFTGAGADLVSGIGFRSNGAIVFTTYAGSTETLHERAIDGTITTSPTQLGGVRLGCRLVESSDGTITRLGSEGVFELAPAATTWRLFGGRGLGRSANRLVRSGSGAVAAEASDFYLLDRHGFWQKVALPSEAAVEFSWALDDGFGLLLADGSVLRIAGDGTATLRQTIDPAVAVQVFGATESSDGTLVLRITGESLVYRADEAAPRVLQGGEAVIRYAAEPSGRIWGVSGSTTARLQPGATRWQPGLSFEMPPFTDLTSAATIQSTSDAIWLPSRWPCRAAFSTDRCEPVATHLLDRAVENIAYDEASDRPYVSTADGIFALSKTSSTWVPVGNDTPVTQLVLVAGDGFLYGRSNLTGIWRVPFVD